MSQGCYGLSPTARMLVRICGLQTTLKLAKARGGQEIYIPKVRLLRDTNAIVGLIGMEASAALAAELGGTRVIVPMCLGALRAERDREIWRRYMDGESEPSIARAVGLTWRSVQKITYRLRMSGGPPDAPAEVERASRQLKFDW